MTIDSMMDEYYAKRTAIANARKEYGEHWHAWDGDGHPIEGKYSSRKAGFAVGKGIMKCEDADCMKQYADKIA